MPFVIVCAAELTMFGWWLFSALMWLPATATATGPTPASPDHGRLPRMAWMGTLFDHHGWTTDYLRNASHVCRQHFTAYLVELKRDNPWATKINDASGRYNGQFFFGNDFWLGSSSLCTELVNENEETSVPPFNVHFNVAKVEILVEEQSRQLLIGQCLPASCTQQELASVLVQDATRANSRTSNGSVHVLDVRRVPGAYSLLHDTKFHILGGVTVTVVIIVVIATTYELYLLTRSAISTENEVEASTNNNNDLKRIDTLSNGNEKVKEVNREKKHLGTGVPSRLLLCFSAATNGRRILDMGATSDDSIRCVHGLRFISVSWVILVHTYLQVFAVGENKGLRVVTERFFFYQSISNATFSVDTFFFISGLLVTILYLRSAAAKATDEGVVRSARRFLLLLFYRMMRLTPAYLFVLGMHELAMRYLHNSSVFEPNLYDHETCAKYWWRNALYINTWYPQSEICMLWSWYMSNDMQFYVLGVILLLVAARSATHLRVAALLVLLLLLSAATTTFLISYQYNYVMRIEEPFALFDQLYDKPWTRVGPYLVGMATGWMLHVRRTRSTIPQAAAAAAWPLSFACLGALVYGVGNTGLRLPLSAFYVSLGHSAWALALAWITFACSTGHGGPINALLSFRGFLPFSRLTYCAYLLHPVLMCITTYQMDGPIHLHNGLVLVLYFGNVIVAFLLSFLISLGFEAPVVRLLKMTVGARE